MSQGFTRITGLSLAVVMLGFGPVWAGGYKHAGAGADIKSETGAGVSGGMQGSPAVGGALGIDTSVDGQVEPKLTQPEEPSASPRMETEPSARDRSRGGDMQAPRSDENLNRSSGQAPRSDQEAPGAQSPRIDDKDTQSPRSEKQ